MRLNQAEKCGGFDPVAYINTPRWQQMKPGLERIGELLEGLGRPQDKLRFVHVAGTNGKGSTCSFIASVLQSAGLRTGLFTSPYIERFEERIRIDSKDIGADELLAATLEVRAVAEQMQEHPTEFELMCAVALVHFVSRNCDIVVLEVGLGGRWDATNIISAPDVCVICRLGLDHTGLLGETLPEIAVEKAGIIKRGCSVVSWPQDAAAMAVIERVCAEKDAILSVAEFSELHVERLMLGDAAATAEAGAATARTSAVAGAVAGAGATAAESVTEPVAALPSRRFIYRGRNLRTTLLGSYQPFNAALALDALDALRTQGWNIPEAAISQGIANTRWPGRFEVCGTNPLFIVDGGHNPQGARVMAETLRELLPNTQPIFLIGVLADKDYPAMLKEVAPLGGGFVCVTPDNPRALNGTSLADEIRALVPSGILVERADDFAAAVSRSRALAGNTGVVCAFGSLYSIASIKAALRTSLHELHI